MWSSEVDALLTRISADHTITPQVMRSPRNPVEQVVTRLLIHRGYEVFNQRELKRAFFGLQEDLEWVFVPSVFDFGTIRGRDELVRRFEEIFDTFDYQVRIVEYADDGEHIEMRLHGRFRTRRTELAMDLVFLQTWDWEGDRLVVREREIETETGIDAAFSAAPRER